MTKHFDVDAYERQQRRAERAGSIKGRHYTTYVEEVKQLKREQRYKEAEKLLLRLIKAVEAQAEIDGLAIPPWYYQHLMIVYNKMKEPAKAEAIGLRLDEQRKLQAQRHERATAEYMHE